MSVQSMTGHAYSERKVSSGLALRIELKSVNHRFREIKLRSSSSLSHFEGMCRKKLEKFFKRGRIEANISVVDSGDENSLIDIDWEKVKTLLQRSVEELGAEHIAKINPTSLLRSEFTKQVSSVENLDKSLEDLLAEVSQKMLKEREREGKELVATMLKHLEGYEELREKIFEYQAESEAKIKQKFDERFKEIRNDINDELKDIRFHQELVYYLEKWTVDEELERMGVHLKELRNILSNDLDEKGKKIDFLLQELNRETNTTGQKSHHVEISQSVVQMKLLLEKIREQNLNLQ